MLGVFFLAVIPAKAGIQAVPIAPSFSWGKKKIIK
jgi:hypothetical protein